MYLELHALMRGQGSPLLKEPGVIPGVLVLCEAPLGGFGGEEAVLPCLDVLHTSIFRAQSTVRGELCKMGELGGQGKGTSSSPAAIFFEKVGQSRQKSGEMHLSFHCNELTSPHTTTVTRVSLLGHRGLGLTDFF